MLLADFFNEINILLLYFIELSIKLLKHLPIRLFLPSKKILSGISVEDFLVAIAKKDITQLNGIPGVGAKTAERLALELHDKLKDIIPEQDAKQVFLGEVTFDDALSALLNLGYKKLQAEKALKSVYSQENKDDLEHLIKCALVVLS